MVWVKMAMIQQPKHMLRTDLPTYPPAHLPTHLPAFLNGLKIRSLWVGHPCIPGSRLEEQLHELGINIFLGVPYYNSPRPYSNS